MQNPSSPAAPPAAPATTPRPLTTQDVAMLRAWRTELSNQLQSADGRRQRLVKELEGADDAARPGLEQRLAVLDRRIVQLETDISETGRQLVTASVGPTGRTTASTASAPVLGGLSPDQVTTLGGVFTLVVLGPLALATARLMWKRAASPPRLPAALTESAERLGRLEQAVEAIAIEIERVSEGQRFVTRILSETQSVPALGAGQAAAEPIALGERQRVPRSGG